MPINILKIITNKIRSYLGVWQLFFSAIKELKAESYDVIYGYEHIGAQALILLKFFRKIDKEKTVTRFQGTWMSMYLKQKRYLKLMLNLDFLWALRFKSDLMIMTDDGTQGDYIVQKINSRHTNFKFWVNGVDLPNMNLKSLEELNLKLKPETFVILSISRLESWKKVDRGIEIIKTALKKDPSIKNKIKYLIVGEGTESQRLHELVNQFKLKEVIEFTGAVPHEMVYTYLERANAFFSFYDLSNVGNPLLEALRSQKIVFTLANGDTAKWVNHKTTGYIYDPNSNFIEATASDLVQLVRNSEKNEILSNIKALTEEKLWTWKERFDAEIHEVNQLISNP